MLGLFVTKLCKCNRRPLVVTFVYGHSYKLWDYTFFVPILTNPESTRMNSVVTKGVYIRFTEYGKECI